MERERERDGKFLNHTSSVVENFMMCRKSRKNSHKWVFKEEKEKKFNVALLTDMKEIFEEKKVSKLEKQHNYTHHHQSFFKMS